MHFIHATMENVNNALHDIKTVFPKAGSNGLTHRGNHNDSPLFFLNCELFLRQVNTCLEYIAVQKYLSGGTRNTVKGPGENGSSSYSLKHDAEWFGRAVGLEPYVPNMAFIVAGFIDDDVRFNVIRNYTNPFYNLKNNKNFHGVISVAKRSREDFPAMPRGVGYLFGHKYPEEFESNYDWAIYRLSELFWRSLLNPNNKKPRHPVQNHPLFREYSASVAEIAFAVPSWFHERAKKDFSPHAYPFVDLNDIGCEFKKNLGPKSIDMKRSTYWCYAGI